MPLQFCPECGKPLRSKEGKVICTCGFNAEAANISFTERIDKPKIGKGVAKKDKKTGLIPHKCTKCGHDKAEVTDLGASYSDETNIYLFTCEKCGHVDREAFGSSNR